MITGTPLYGTNESIYIDLKFPVICKIIKTTSQGHNEHLENHPKSIVKTLLETNSRRQSYSEFDISFIVEFRFKIF